MEVNNPDWDTNLSISFCWHTITFSNLSRNDASSDGIQYINPSQPAVYLPPGKSSWHNPVFQQNTILTQENPVAICDEECMATAVLNTLLPWWGILGMAQVDMYCYGGMLAPAMLASAEDANQTCPSFGEIWNNTLALMLDGIIQTYPRVGNSSQNCSFRRSR